MTANAIEAVGLSKKFRVPSERRTSLKERFVRGKAPEARVFWALKDATFSVPKGSSLGLIGQNGSGKSTALKVLTGIYRPTSGQVAVNGSVSALLEVGAGFHPELTGRENIRLNATILGFTNREIDRMMDQIIEFADIGEHIDGPIKHYSSGMYVRLGFAVAVMVRPEILIVDEVIAVGDEEFQRKCYEHLFELRRAGTTMVIVSHGLAQITDLCDDAVWLDGGHIRELGSSKAVVRAYLDAINVREAERESRAGHAPVPTGIPHRGSGQIRVTDLSVSVPGEEVPQVVRQGAPATFRLHYEAPARVDDVKFEMVVANAEDTNVLVLQSDPLGSRRVAEGRATVEFVADPVLLAPGLHSVTTMVKSSGHVVDAIDRYFRFTVQSHGSDPGGTFVQPGAWQDPVRDFAGGLDLRRIIFVAGCPHSGTGLLATSLGRSPDVALLQRETGWFTRAMSGDAILADLRDLTGIPLEHTPGHVFHIGSIWSAFPNARVVLAVRDPLGTVASLLENCADLDRALAEYLESTRRVRQIVDSGRAELVRLEDLLTDPEGILRGLCRELDIAYSDEMVTQAHDLTDPLVDVRAGRRANLSGGQLERVVAQTRDLAGTFGYRLIGD